MNLKMLKNNKSQPLIERNKTSLNYSDLHNIYNRERKTRLNTTNQSKDINNNKKVM